MLIIYDLAILGEEEDAKRMAHNFNVNDKWLHKALMQLGINAEGLASDAYLIG